MSFNIEEVQTGSNESEGSAQIREIVALGEKLHTLAKEIAEAEETLSAKKKEHKDLAEGILVDQMNILNLSSFKLSTGHTVEKKPFVHGRIAKADEAFQWLRDNHEDGIIKNKIEVTLGTGDTQTATEIMADLSLRGVVATQKESVHPSTLKSFLKEALADEALKDSLPRDAFGVYEGETVKLTNP